MLTFFVAGKPQTAGSKTAMPITNGAGERVATRVLESGDRELKKTWRQAIQTAAREAMNAAGADRLEGPVRVTFVFQRPRAKGHYGSGRNERVLKPSAPLYPDTKPDALKLARAAEDALTGVVWRDDAQVVDGRQRKVYVDRFDGVEGVRVEVAPMDGPTDAVEAAAESLALFGSG